MGIPKQKWTSEEEEALRAGVRKHGTGKWMNIQRDPEFRSLLSSRSNIDLKDKWRNLTVSASNCSIPRDKWRTQKPKPNPDVSADPFPIVFRQPPPPPPPPPPPSSATHIHDASTNVIDDTSGCKIDSKTASKYDAMIYEALLEVNDLNGSDISTIVSLIEKKHDVAPNFRRLLCPRLRRLVAQGKLEKVDNSYRMKGLIKPPQLPQSPKSRDSQMTMQVESPGYGDTIEEASWKAAACIADIENKTFVAAEAVKEAERVSRMCEDAYAFLDFANDIYERSLVDRVELTDKK